MRTASDSVPIIKNIPKYIKVIYKNANTSDDTETIGPIDMLLKEIYKNDSKIPTIPSGLLCLPKVDITESKPESKQNKRELIKIPYSGYKTNLQPQMQSVQQIQSVQQMQSQHNNYYNNSHTDYSTLLIPYMTKKFIG